MLSAILELAPAVVGFHFGLPSADTWSALRARGRYLMATATSFKEASAVTQSEAPEIRESQQGIPPTLA